MKWLDFGWKRNAGLVSVTIGDWAFHVIVQPRYWLLGYRSDEPGCEVDLRSFGFGPIFLVCWIKVWD